MIIAICPKHNSKGKKDVSGAFLPEAVAFVGLHGGKLFQFDNHAPPRIRAAAVEQAIWNMQGAVDMVAIFCHGTKRGIQTGHSIRALGHLAEVIGMRSSPEHGPRVVLYCCDTARDADTDAKDDLEPGPGGEGGFADYLRDELRDLGYSSGHIDAHTVVGHTTKAPYVRRFYVDETRSQLGGEWFVEPGSAHWKAWRRGLQSDSGLRWRFPFAASYRNVLD